MIDAKRLRDVIHQPADAEEMAKAIRSSFGSASPETVRGFRARMSALLRQVRGGQVSLIGQKAADQVVVISVRDLASLLIAARKPRSFAAALAAIPGFEPVGEPIRMYQRQRRVQAVRVRT